MSYLAPAGTPVSLATYVRSLSLGLRRNSGDNLARALATHAGHTQGWLFSTGRAAMVVALQALKDASNDSRRNEVIVAGYTCYSVPASVLRAGLKPRLCDIDTRTLSLDLGALKQFDLTKVLAIVSANLYGLPNALHDIEAIARESGVALLDDAAQALGAKVGQRPVGGFGAVGLYSFDKGKNITSLEGGALVASDPLLTAVLQRRWESLGAGTTVRSVQNVVKLAAYSALLHPPLYGLVQKLPFLGLGLTRYEDDYPLHRYPPVLSGFARVLFERLPELMSIRRRNALALREALRPASSIAPIDLLDGAEPSYTRLPVLVQTTARRTQLITDLNRHGIGATASYPAALCDVPELLPHIEPADRATEGAREVARRIMTLPVHPFCPPGYAERIAAICTSSQR